MEMILNGITEAIKLLVSGDSLVLDAAWRSIWVSTTAVIIGTILGISMGTFLARHRFTGRGLVVTLFRGMMGVPTVLIGLIGYALLARQGPLGTLELLYTSWGIVIGEVLLAVPIITSLTHGGIKNLDPRIPETALMLGAGPLQRWKTYLSEARLPIMLAILTAFARCFTELGIAIMVGGNLKFKTRTLSTSTTLETARGEFSRAVAMSLILLAIAICITVIIAFVSREDES
ncbi:MAG: ABC transporter permease [Planctomycetaceae bacterium]|nr:ABC transporter permease [Planctomycetaceae bacterium]|tara:strand:- start:114 stop:809 length:696 start_codon:yes stop_codon:yes gene_type:complete